jgi:SulP family sulfate permease
MDSMDTRGIHGCRYGIHLLQISVGPLTLSVPPCSVPPLMFQQNASQNRKVLVIVGVIVSALVFAWKSASRIRAIERSSKTEKGAKVYEIEGPLFFSSTNSFIEIFNPSEDPKVIIIDFARSKVIDQSALKAIEDIAERYNSIGKKVKLRHLTRDCHKLLSKAGQLVVNSDDDPDYSIVVDYDVKLGIFGN